MALLEGTLQNQTQTHNKIFYGLNCELFGSPWFVGGFHVHSPGSLPVTSHPPVMVQLLTVLLWHSPP
eukprot:10028147-Ditylum_brightwellii.AAC.1